MPSFKAFAGVASAPSSAPLDTTETLLFRGGMMGNVREQMLACTLLTSCERAGDSAIWLTSRRGQIMMMEEYYDT